MEKRRECKYNIGNDKYPYCVWKGEKMDRIIELGYIFTLLISIACITVHAAIRAKNLTSASRMMKWKSTTAFLLLVMLFNVCDFLILYLKGSVGAEVIAWIYVIENLLEVGLAYAMICMERDYAGSQNPHWLDIIFVIVAMIILYADSVYTLKPLFKSESTYVIIMITLNLIPILLLTFFGLRLWSQGRSNREKDGHKMTDIYMLMYNLVCIILCVISTTSIVDSRTRHDFIGYDKEIYVAFWFVFNVVNFIFIWRSCVVDDRDEVQRIQSPEEKLASIMDGFNLSQREKEIAELIFCGKNNKEIAAILYLSPNTIKVHASNLYRKLGAANRVQAAQVLRGEEITAEVTKEE